MVARSSEVSQPADSLQARETSVVSASRLLVEPRLDPHKRRPKSPAGPTGGFVDSVPTEVAELGLGRVQELAVELIKVFTKTK